ncbi:fasciclin domain-containing protein [Jannaschia sp. S6380]|uniref:fasciclin domain-containing protein n=1 Tax=Jannaschia sp. S6380 TaxID=2926408 RepID=UPI001FF0F6D4|nr:fasciclin domain-containing protein [Jannaschia sp. S6380]MCK0167306.1 fasciclin domain-containing protein [Jannaschia sp. S6380]
MKTLTIATTAALTLATAAPAEIMVGGAEMFADRNIIENAVNSADHETLVAAVKAADLVETLQGEGPFTVFAPTDAAFARISDASLNALLAPENKAQLQQVLTCHVVAADVMAGAIRGMIDDDGGSHPVPTLGGCVLDATYDGDAIMLTDENGRVANVTIADVAQSNGVIHVIDRVLLPKQ